MFFNCKQVELDQHTPLWISHLTKLGPQHSLTNKLCYTNYSIRVRFLFSFFLFFFLFSFFFSSYIACRYRFDMFNTIQGNMASCRSYMCRSPRFSILFLVYFFSPLFFKILILLRLFQQL